MPTLAIGFTLSGPSPATDTTDVSYTGISGGIRLELTGAQTYVVDLAMIPAAGLRGLGVVAALDDYGVARGTILALRAIPFPMVKLHPSLCAGLDGENLSARRALALTTGQVETAHALGTIVVAKSVETLAQLRALEKAGCDAMQGWLLGRPGKVPNLTE